MSTMKRCLIVLAFMCSTPLVHALIEFDGGVSADIDYFVDDNVFIYDATVNLYSPAHITGAVVCDSYSTLNIYGGQIDNLLLIFASGIRLPQAQVTIYGSDFELNGTPLTSDTTELFMSYQSLTGVYSDGTPFSFTVGCYILGRPGYIEYGTIKLAWTPESPSLLLLGMGGLVIRKRK